MLTIVLSDAAAESRVEFGDPALLFISLDLEQQAADSPIDALVVTHLTGSSSTAEDRDNDISLELEFSHDVGTTSIEILAPDSGRVLPSTPLTLARSPGALELDWGPSCAASDEDFAIYLGTLGDFGSHAPLTCSTDGATSAVVDEPGESVYFLIVPSSGTIEGSYGLIGDGEERAPGRSTCRLQIVGACR